MAHKEMLRIIAFAQGKGLDKTLKAAYVATELHEGQTRKGGQDYIVHPSRVTTLLMARNIHDDIILATALLHDVLEDCNISEHELIYKYGIDPEVVKNVKLLSYTKGTSKDEYYKRISENPICLLVKIADRCNNISTMSGVFSIEKMKEYVEETEKYILPLCRYGKNHYPQYSNEIFTLKCHIEDVMSPIKQIVDEYKKNKRESQKVPETYEAFDWVI